MARRMRVLGVILAGGQGRRLHPLTARRTKAAVPFGAKYRIIDFALNNLVNSGVYGIYVITQFKAQSLTEHIQRYWRLGAFLDDHFILLVPAQMYRYEELGPVWYRGTADALYQNLHLLENRMPESVCLLGADHIYKMNVRHMVEFHERTEADITIAGYCVPVGEASRFGVLHVDDDWRLLRVEEKPAVPAATSAQPERSLVSMGNYIFKTQALLDLVQQDAHDPESLHDLGGDVLPRAVRSGYRVMVYDFVRNPIPGQTRPNTYWRDVGTLDAYFDASMDLVKVVPDFDLFNPDWPLRTANLYSPPSKFVHEAGERVGRAFNSLLAGGIIISGGTVRESVLFRRVRINSHALVERSVLFDDVDIGRYCQVRNAIVDKDVVLPPHARIGFDPEEDRARGFTITEAGVVGVPKGWRA